MHGLFREIQISQEAHKCRQHPARFGPVKILNGAAVLFRRRLRHHAKLTIDVEESNGLEALELLCVKNIVDWRLPIADFVGHESSHFLIEFLKVVQVELSGCTYALCPKTTLRGTPNLRFIVISRDFETASRLTVGSGSTRRAWPAIPGVGVP